MKSHAIAVFMILLVTGVVGCSRNEPPADALPVPGPTGTEAVKAEGDPSAEPVNPLADFTVDPGVVFACDGKDRVVATVKWQVKDPSVTTVRVEVDTAADPMRKTFSAGGAVGEAVTEDWVGEGVRFHLVDAATDKELASYEVTSKPCEG